MLGNDPFYNGSIRKVVVAFGSLFTDIHIVRTNGSVTNTIKVPLSYGPKEKWLVRNMQDPMPNIDEQVEMVLPRMTYKTNGFTYDTSRQLAHTGMTVKTVTGDRSMLLAQFNPTPWNIGFELSIMTKTVEDALMIVEQIIPFFVPDYTVSVNDIPELNLLKDIPIVLNNVSSEDTYDGSLNERRTITWTLNFTAKAYLYPPVQQKKIVLDSIMNFDIDGSSAPSGLPHFSTTSLNNTDTADNVVDSTTALVQTSILLVPVPTQATLSPNQSATFKINVLNTSNTAFTEMVPTTSQTGADTNSSTATTFTYTCGSGVRTTQETITVWFVSVADPTKESSVSITLNPT